MTRTAITRTKQLLAMLAVLIALLLLRVIDPSLFGALRGSGFDTLQQIWPRTVEEAQPVRVVDIDEKSLKALGQWPWSRITLAKLVDQLHGMGAAAIVFDIVFPEPDRLSPQRILNDENLKAQFANPVDIPNTSGWPNSDAVFATSLSNRPTVMAFATSPSLKVQGTVPQKSGFAQTGASAINAPQRLGVVTSNLTQLNTAAAGIGGINIDLAGEQGVARQIPFLWTDGERFATSLAVEALRVAQGVDTLLVNAAPETEDAIESLRIGEFEVPLTERGQFFVHYRPNDPALYVSAIDILSPDQRPGLKSKIEGNIVFIGTSAVGLLDVRTTALGETVPGVSIHAQATEQILQGKFLSRPEWLIALELAGTFLLGLLIASAAAFFRPLPTLAVATATIIGALAASVLAFRNAGLLLDATFPVAALTLTFLASVAWRLFVTDREGRQMRGLFSRYVAPSVLDDIEKNPHNLKLGGEVRDVTVMFIDIANFTPLSEKLSPTELVQTVNGLWNVCTKAILAEQGTIDKFIGDAIMAFWNAPIAVTEHQYRATKAAIAIREAVAAYNDTPALSALLHARGIVPIAVRVGIATGPACVGNMGSEDRFDYSVLGETVNTAARTEATGKHVGHDILIAGSLDAATQALATLPAGHAPMKGISNLTNIHAIVGNEDLKQSQLFKELEKEHKHIAGRLAEMPKAKSLTTLRQLLHELALHHPVCERYLKTMAERPEDFTAIKQQPAP